MDNNFIQTAGSAGHVVTFTIGPIFKRIMANGFTDIVKASIVSGLWA